MRNFIILIFILITSSLNANEWEDRQVFSSGNHPKFKNFIKHRYDVLCANYQKFFRKNPNIKVEYFVTGTASLDKIFRKSPEQYDLIISSAMDLQLKLVNDGYAKKSMK